MSPVNTPIVWYRDRPIPGFPTERLCQVTRIQTVRTATGWTRWAYCTQHHWVAPTSHVMHVLAAELGT